MGSGWTAGQARQARHAQHAPHVRPGRRAPGTRQAQPARDTRPSQRWVQGTAAIAAAALGIAIPLAAYGFAVEYRRRAGLPARRPPVQTPAGDGLPFDAVSVPSPAGPLPAWFIPAPGGRPGPAVVLVHGWESNRARMLPNARFLHAAGFHTLMFDVRGHGENPAETLPITGGEFGADAGAAVRFLLARDDVTRVGILGHSMGAAGACIAAATTPGVAALVATSTPAHAHRLTRRTFQLAGLRIPGPVAGPLAWLTLRVFLRPRGHAPSAVSADAAVSRFDGPVLLVHGALDEVVPVADLDVLEAAARANPDRPVERLVVGAGYHRWLYEDPGYRRQIAAFFARHLGGPLAPDEAGAVAAALDTPRPPDTEGTLTALDRAASSPDGDATGPT